MEITFDNSTLRKCANNERQAIRKLGPRRAELFKKRLEDIRDSETLEDTRHLPGNYHDLTSNRKGQWACNLDHPYRLIFEPHEDPIPVNDDGVYQWEQIRGIEVIEIENYH